MLATECSGIILAKIHRNQMDDGELMVIRNKIDNNQTEKYTIQNGFLYREWTKIDRNTEINAGQSYKSTNAAI